MKKSFLIADIQKRELGPTIKGTIRSFEFIITNTSDSDVTPKIDVSCGCTTPTLTPSTIPAGGTATLSAKFDSMGKKGVIEKSIWLSVPGSNTTNLTLKFNTTIVDR